MRKLNSYMRENNLTLAKFAKKIGSTAATVQRWTSGNARPSIRLAIAVERETKGAVSVYDWK